jgi:peptidoglycan/LPS O-acetylase OafA/YrhL
LGLSAVIGWFLGSFYNHFNYALYSWVIGAVVTLIIAVPSWPCFNTNPQRWVKHTQKKQVEALSQ